MLDAAADGSKIMGEGMANRSNLDDDPFGDE